jgi:MFS family permease
MEAAAGFGLMLGPPIGSLLYGQFGYAWAFYFFSILLGYNLISTILFVPGELNYDKESSIQVRESILDDHGVN